MAAPLVAAGAGITLMKVLQNRTFWIIVGAIILVWIIYKAGKNAQKASDAEPSWWDKLLGRDKEEEEEKEDRDQVNLPPGANAGWKPNTITDAIFHAYDNHRWYSSNADAINAAWASFNALNETQKGAVVNDWDDRYESLDKPGWGTGDYGTLKATVEEYADNLVPQAEIALAWLRGIGVV